MAHIETVEQDNSVHFEQLPAFDNSFTWWEWALLFGGGAVILAAVCQNTP